MTSPKSLKNNFGYAYRTGLRDNAVVAIAQFLISAYVFIATPISVLFQKTTAEQYDIKKDAQFVLTMNMEFLRYLVIVAFIGCGILLGIKTFKFMVGKKTMNVYYSLGIKRTHLFTAKYLSGLTLMAIAIFVPILVAVLMNIIVIGASSHLFVAALYYFLGLFSLSAVAYSLTALVFSAVGTAFEGILFSGIIILFPTIFLQSLQTLIEKLVLGTPYGVNFIYGAHSDNRRITLLNEYKSVNPLMYLSEGLYSYMNADAKGQLTDYNTGNMVNWVTPDFAILVVWLLISGALFAAATYVYEHRKAEIGGFIGKNKFLNFICTFAIGFFGFVSVFTVFSDVSAVVKLFIGLVVFVLIYAVLDFLLIRNFREFAKGLYKLPIHLGITVVLFTFFFTGYFGAEYKLPKVEEIQSVQVTTVNNNYSMDTSDVGFSLSLGSVYLTGVRYPSGEYQTQADIEKITAIHQKLLDNGELLPKDFVENPDDAYPMYFKIIYTLKNGDQVLRAFYGVNTEVYNMILELDKTDYRTERLHDAFYGSYRTDYTDEELKTIFQGSADVTMDYRFNQYKRALQAQDSPIKLYNKLLDGELLQLTESQRKTLLDCVYQDISAMTVQQRYNPSATYGALSFGYSESSSIVETDGENAAEVVYDMVDESMQTPTDHAGCVLLEDFRVDNSAYQTSFYLSDETEKTIAYLKELGVYDRVINQKPTISAAFVNSLAEDRDYQAYYFEFRYDLGKEFVIQNGTSEYDGYRIKTTDADLIAELYNAAVMRSLVSIKNGYTVEFKKNENAYLLYIDGDKLSEEFKAKVKAAQMQFEGGYYGG